jgi:hypothetical protein
MLASLTCCRAKNIGDIAHSYDPLSWVYDPTVSQLRIATDGFLPAGKHSRVIRKRRTP